MHYHLVSPGGCGTHGLFHFLAQNGVHKVPGWNTHVRWNPTLKINDPRRMVYLYADPYDTILSFERRQFLCNDKHLTNMGGDQAMLKDAPHNKWDLLEYLNNGRDYFRLEDHLKTWLNATETSVMFVKYEELPEHLPRVFDRWGVDPDLAPQFDFVPRLSNWRDASPDVIDGLRTVYGRYRDYLQTLDGCFVR